MINIKFVKEGKNSTIDLISLMKKNKGGIVILLSRPYISFRQDLKKAKINENKFLFIDTTGTENSTNVISVPIKSLTALSISISEVLQRLPIDKRLIIFDSIDSFLAYHDENTFIKFLIFTINSINQMKAKAQILISNSSKEKRFYSILIQNSDKLNST